MNRASPLTAYADAMKDVAALPDDADVADDINPWKLWALDGTPTPGTEEIVAPLYPRDRRRRRMRAGQSRPPSGSPLRCRWRGILCICQRVFGSGSDDLRRRLGQRKGSGGRFQILFQGKPIYYYAMITGHNYQFLAASRAMQGHQADTIAAGRKSRAAVPDEILTGCAARLVCVVSLL